MTGMARFVWAQLRGRAARTVALFVGVAVATTGFTVLFGSTATSRTSAEATVRENFRGAYDILVRPKGNRSPQETAQGLVRPNFLSGQFGGVSLDQWRAVQKVPGVEVAAPIAMVGYAATVTGTKLDITGSVDRTRTSQLLRLDLAWHGDRGLSTAADPVPGYVYVTTNRLVWPVFTGGRGTELRSDEPMTFTDGRSRPVECKRAIAVAYELLPDGGERQICPRPDADGPTSRVGTEAVRLTADGRFESYHLRDGPTVSDRLYGFVRWPIPMLVAAVDPAAEAALVGLDSAVVSGRYLTRATATETGSVRRLPALVVREPLLDEQVSMRAQRLGAGIDLGSDPDLLATAAAEGAVTVTDDAATVYARDLATGGGRMQVSLVEMVQAGTTRYTENLDGSLNPRTLRQDAAQSWINHGGRQVSPMPWLSTDRQLRPLSDKVDTDSQLGSFLFADSVGVFDPSRLRAGGALSGLPLETYGSASAVGADRRSADLLGGRALRPNGNVAGYLATPPQVLTSLEFLPELVSGSAPLSALRVRVAGVTGPDDASLARANAVAAEIARTTGLDVDVVLGSSAVAKTVALPAGSHGRPPLLLSEQWARKGVASAVVSAVDRRSGVLIALILVVCGLFLANAVAAGVRDRRRDLAVLACIGWPARRIYGAVLAEVVLVGAAAGAVAALLAPVLGEAVGLRIPVAYALLAVPAAAALALLAGALPAARAARSRPAGMVRADVVPVNRAARRRTVAGLALSHVGRVPARTVAGVVALAVGVCALTVQLAVSWTFQEALAGTYSILGDAVLREVAAVDRVAVVVTVLLGAVAVADVGYLNVRERAAEFAVLHALGWTGWATGRLVLFEGLAVGVLGASVGAGTGLGIVAALVGGVPGPVRTAALIAAGTGVVVSAVSTVVPALSLRRLPTAALLAPE